MKFEQKSGGFSPITITIESEAEATFIRALVGEICNKDTQRFGLGEGFAGDVFKFLDKVCSKSFTVCPQFSVKPK